MRDKFCLKAAIPEEKEERGCPSMVKIILLNLTQQALNCISNLPLVRHDWARMHRPHITGYNFPLGS